MVKLKYSIVLLLLIGCFLWTGAQAQAPMPSQIGQIEFDGLRKNKESFLRRVIESEAGHSLDLEKIQNDLKYLKQLSGVAMAEYRIDTTENGLTIQFQIEEAKTFFPIVNFGGIRDNFWFQLGANEMNLRGRGDQLTVYYQNIDRRHNFNVFYRLPFINGSRWGGTVNVRRFASVEPIYFDESTVFYDYNNNSLGASIFYQLQSNHFIEFGTTFFTERFAKNERHQGEVTPGPDEVDEPKLLFKAIHQINEIDWHYFYQDGFVNQLNVESVYNLNFGDWFLLVFNDTHYFKRLGKRGNLATRLRLGISSNGNNPFAPFVLDSYINIRGSGNRIDRGTGVIVLNVEYRHTFFEERLFAGQVVGFSDAGTWRNPGGPLSDLTDIENFRHFVGAGFRIIYKKAFNAMIRVDYGVDIYDPSQRGFVLGFGQYF
ncbi:MAG: BamA/TamA family outer membrane protein [Bacteroidota bacterium]